jgi:hypothetical protein
VVSLTDNQPVHVSSNRWLPAPDVLVVPQEPQSRDRRAVLADHVPLTCIDLAVDLLEADLARLPLPDTSGGQPGSCRLAQREQRLSVRHFRGLRQDRTVQSHGHGG